MQILISILPYIIQGIVSLLVCVIPIILVNSKERKKDKNVYCESIKCLLRNAMLGIYDNCKEKKEITLYQKQSFNYMYEQYKSMKRNSFIDDLKEQIDSFKLKDWRARNSSLLK